jgi:hypothetical protein
MINCTISDNTAAVNGGGIFNGGNVTLTNCTISNNRAEMSSVSYGGGIYANSGNTSLTNCTISGNYADEDGGGIYIPSDGDANVTLVNCTITNNEAEEDAGGFDNHGGIWDLTLTCTIVYGNIADSNFDFRGPYTGTSPESIVGGFNDPLLGPLQDNGGPTETHALMIGSPAIDACINGCTVDTDQRGDSRPIDGDYDSIANCDVGAYEYEPPPLPTPSPVPTISQWGMIGMGMVLAVALVWSIRRRWVVRTSES